MNRPSTVYFVGSGPGDPELITVKGKKLLEEADVVVYAGSLVKERVLTYCRKDAVIYNSASMTLEEITEAIIGAVREGKKVVRLHSGDPSLYSALNEQIEILEREGIDCEVIPGVCSAFSASAGLKRELTIPGLTQTVILTRLEGRTPVPERERLSSLAKHRATMCIFLSVGMIDRVVTELKEGYPAHTPVAVVYRASWEDEIIIKGTLKDISEKIKRRGIKRHAVIIVGTALEGYGKRTKLYNKDFKHGYR